MPLKENQPAPDFTLRSTSGRNFTLSEDMYGKPCIIYFYPKDFTPTCTREACEFRDMFSMFTNLDIEIIGISRDDIETHQRFKQQYNLPFELLADTDGKVAGWYKALIPIVKITRRITYLLDENHRIAAAFESMFTAEKHISIMVEKVKSGAINAINR
jgi:peroxiredoxin Q/BCP